MWGFLFTKLLKYVIKYIQFNIIGVFIMEFVGIIVCSIRDIVNNFSELKDKNKKGYICDFYSKELMKKSKYFIGSNLNDCIINFTENVYRQKHQVLNKDEVESGYIFLVEEYFGKEYISLNDNKILKMFGYELENWKTSINWIQVFDTQDGKTPDVKKCIKEHFRTTNFYGENFALINNYRIIEAVSI